MIQPSKDFLKFFRSINGAFSVTEAVALSNILSEVKEGTYLELGVAFGKSAAVAVNQLKPNLFYLVDPEFENQEHTKDVNFKLTMVSKKFTLVYSKLYSTDFLVQSPGNEGLFSYTMIDSGSHQDGLPMREVKLLEDRMIQGGVIAFHDYKSQFSEVEQAYNYLVGTGKYEPIQINWNEIIQWVAENDLEKGNVSWHHTELEYPCFLGAVRKK